MKELQGALRRLQIQNLETLLALADLEETALNIEIQSPHTSEERRIAAKKTGYTRSRLRRKSSGRDLRI
jgi:hypothetical protein